jgi:putative MATE family efflux protein
VKRRGRGSLSRTVWALTWPSVTALLLQTLTNNVDRLFVARLGGAEVAAMGLSQNLLMFLFAAVVAVSTATTAMVARFIGAGSVEEAEEATRQSLILSLAAAFLLMVLLAPLADTMLAFLAGGATDIVPLAKSYFLVSLPGLAPLFLLTVLIAAFRGTADMLTPVRLTLVAAVLNAALDYVFIFGKLGSPAMGLNGAALAAVVSRVAACALAFIWLGGSRLNGTTRRWTGLSRQWAGRILGLGLPAGLQTLLRSGASIVYFSLLGLMPEGRSAMAALTIGLGIEAIAFMPGFAYSTAAAALVGQNLGGGHPERARQAAWTCARQSVIVMTVMAAAFFALAPQIARLFTGDAGIVALTVSYLRINALSEPFLAVAMALGGALQGAGDTRSPTVATFLTLWVIRLPATWLAAVHLGHGAVAAWWAMSGSMALYGMMIALIFSTGRWRRIEI